VFFLDAGEDAAGRCDQIGAIGLGGRKLGLESDRQDAHLDAKSEHQEV